MADDEGHEGDGLQARLADLEARMKRLERAATQEVEAPPHVRPAATAPASAPSATATSSTATAPTAPTRPSATTSPSGSAAGSPETSPDDPFWVLTGLAERYPDDDVVLYAGTMSTDDGGYRWQYGLPTQTLVGMDFADAASALSALAHPVRLTLVQAVLTGTRTTAELSALPDMGTSGQVYHHLNQLASAGWLRSPRRGRWEVPGDRTIPLLALVMAATT